MNPITLSPEAWAAIAAIVTPLVASAVSNMALRLDVRLLSTELRTFRKSLTKDLIGVKKRVRTLEVAAKSDRPASRRGQK